MCAGGEINNSAKGNMPINRQFMTSVSTSPTFGYGYPVSPVFSSSLNSPGFSSASPTHDRLPHFGFLGRNVRHKNSVKDIDVSSDEAVDHSVGLKSDENFSNCNIPIDIGKTLSQSDDSASDV
jgi:hypothetical protein